MVLFYGGSNLLQEKKGEKNLSILHGNYAPALLQC